MKQDHTQILEQTQDLQAKAVAQAGVVVLFALLAIATTGCASKNYVRSQTGPLVQQTNDLDAKTAADHRAIGDTDSRAQTGIANAQSAADAAGQHADAANQSANQAGKNAQEAYNRVDTLTGVVANLDNFKPVSNISVTFATNRFVLTAADRRQLDDFAAQLANTRGYLLEVTGGTDSTGDTQYNYRLSQKRADAVVNYLATKYNVPPHKFYLIGIGKDVQIATDKTSAGRAKNRRVEVKLMTNVGQLRHRQPQVQVESNILHEQAALQSLASPLQHQSCFRANWGFSRSAILQTQRDCFDKGPVSFLRNSHFGTEERQANIPYHV